MCHFDEHARNWDTDPAKVRRAESVAAAMRGHIALRPDMRALEYGCGTGLLSFALRAWLGPVTLMDSSEGMLEVVREKIAASGARDMTPVRLDLTRDPLPAERYDIVYSLLTLHHVPDTAAVLRAFHALLAPAGWLAIADLDAEDGSFHGPGMDVHHGFEREALGAQARAAGFEGVHFETAFEIAKGSGEARRAYPAFLMLARRP